MVAVHEPFCDLAGLGETDIDGRPFDSPAAFLEWLRDDTHDVNVFVKDTPDRRHRELFGEQRFLFEARHAFLIRRPAEIAASFYAVEPDMNIDSIGLETLHTLYTAGDDVGLLLRRRVAIHPGSTHVGPWRSVRVATVRTLARRCRRQLW